MFEFERSFLSQQSFQVGSSFGCRPEARVETRIMTRRAESSSVRMSPFCLSVGLALSLGSAKFRLFI